MTEIRGTDPNILQRNASDPMASVWVSASAGAGKTKVLSDRVLRLMLSGTEPHRILCLTFTKAAAAEMANRVNERLGHWATMEDRELQDDLFKLAGTAPSVDETRRARRLFASVLDAPGGMKIQTIHAFCQSLLRRFPLEAGLAPHFEIMDDRTAAETMADVQEEVLAFARNGRDDDLADALSVVTGQVREGAFGEVMGELARERGRLKRMLIRHGGAARMRDAVYAALGVPNGQSEDDILRKALSDDAFDRDGLMRGLAALEAGTKTDQDRVPALAQFLEKTGIEDRLAVFSDYRGVFFTAAGEPRAKLITKKAAENHPMGADALEAECARLIEIDRLRKAAALAGATSALIRIGNAMLDRYAAKKALHARLDYDDLILTSLQLLQQQAGIAGWVLFKLDEGLDHILIDEAQDTNPEQWEVVRILAEEFFAGAGQHDEKPRTIFAVGDAKQSIYSFQRADPEKFTQMRAYFRERAREIEAEWREVPMNISFRSTDAVLGTVDRVFAGMIAKQGVGDDGADVSHSPFRVGQAGRIELWPAVEPQERAAEDPWTPPTRIVRLEDPEIRLARVIAGRIRHAIDTREELTSRGRPVRAGDFMILVRRRTAFVDEVVKALKERNVPVAGVDRMQITDQLAVMDLIAFGRFLLMPEDDLTLAEVLKSPLIGFDDDQLFAIAHNRPRTLWLALREKAGSDDADPAFLSAYEFLFKWLGRVDYERPFELFAELLGGRGDDARGVRARLVGRLGIEANDPIDEFLNLAMGYEADHAPTLQGFLHWLMAGDAEIKRDLEQSGRDEVRIMTVHGAKGLQAPIVFLPDTMQVPTQAPNLFWQEDRDLMYWLPRVALETDVVSRLRDGIAVKRDQEYNRLLYVALTRAEDRLYICGWQGKRKAPDHCWYNLCQQAMEGYASSETFDFTEFSGSGWSGDGWVWETDQREAPRADKVTAATGTADLSTRVLIRDIAPTEAFPPKPLAPSRPLEEEPSVQSPLGGDQGQSFKRGLLIHKLLELLPDLPEAKRRDAAERFLAQPVHALDADQQREITSETIAIFENPEFAPVFDTGSRAEVPLVGIVGGDVVSAQIDRLVVRENDVMIVDFKTNRPPPRDVEGTPRAYRRQMSIYKAALGQMYPDKNIRCYILWTNGPWMVELPEHIMRL
ncbi:MULTISPECIES: double-strand break repair helicase AddA [Thalassospira]|jgi:ATP-dependent helicase/nuclease subunit A|uniref:DNA 3'-5' helicase n=1 Tax=Thalassospira xiamenensis TaxID=220697 RepID=A0ABR5Y6A8_9PROT|nr:MULTISPECIES: double-strand break repair helicase AddA [Thalassospira]KZD06617.1 DNA helicase UvrD [Thalassospira xiamenensis]KZD10786.1 DNA helicase UvrD [Thalassospira xiamenensis]MAB32406.1 double-strand break repair helicase AddA [Thalassospira sp.]MCD1592687.1 double-strand break repair helicase AddA [Thalassospira xiamenensis]MDM7975033.1 double-strand break repair helicase AddA [Thalassospira xiamenensis]|tara:strand:- start:7577 stop:11038 length:3462 start_codon:yes stop_codon:yes gene_type:complete